jgi:hypothetical protein
MISMAKGAIRMPEKASVGMSSRSTSDARRTIVLGRDDYRRRRSRTM